MTTPAQREHDERNSRCKRALDRFAKNKQHRDKLRGAYAKAKIGWFWPVVKAEPLTVVRLHAHAED